MNATEPQPRPGRVPWLGGGAWRKRLSPRLSRALLWGAAGAGLAVAGAALFLYDPAQGGLFPSCPFHALTGWYCPGCGSTRATHQLLHGNVAGAWRYNPLLVVSLPFIALTLLRRGPVYRAIWARYTPAICGVILVLYGVLRNLPGFAFLAPGGG